MTALDAADINRRFDYHAPVGDKVAKHQQIREQAKSLAATFAILPDGREKSLAFTALEEATFWANAAIARDGT